MSFDAHVLILGGGISGCLIAAALADRDLRVAIVEREPQLMSAASLWNDGKIHLGYTFAGTSSMASAELMQAGTTVFIEGLERALGEPVPEAWFSDSVIYIVDRESMVDPETLWQRAQEVARLHDERARHEAGMRRYLADQPGLARLSVEEAEQATGQTGVQAAWRTPERHIRTPVVAERMRQAILARDIDIVAGEVVGAGADGDGWRVALSDGRALGAPIVVNCLWENRVLVDRTVEPLTEPTSIRYKRALFGSGVTSLAGVASSTRVLGPFGDVIVHRDGSAYLGWYPAGMVARSDDGAPPTVPEPVGTRDTEAIVAGLGLPASLLDDPGAAWQLRGGFVVAWGYGDIDEPDSPLHERYRPRVHEVRPGFFSVDTGKYTLGPLLAERAVELATQAIGRSSPAAVRVTYARHGAWRSEDGRKLGGSGTH